MKYYYIVCFFENDEMELICLTKDYYYAKRIYKKNSKKYTFLYLRKLSKNRIFEISEFTR